MKPFHRKQLVTTRGQTDDGGFSPADLAYDCEHDEIGDFLEEMKNKQNS